MASSEAAGGLGKPHWLGFEQSCRCLSGIGRLCWGTTGWPEPAVWLPGGSSINVNHRQRLRMVGVRSVSDLLLSDQPVLNL
jgi:hypothetical protein